MGVSIIILVSCLGSTFLYTAGPSGDAEPDPHYIYANLVLMILQLGSESLAAIGWRKIQPAAPLTWDQPCPQNLISQTMIWPHKLAVRVASIRAHH